LLYEHFIFGVKFVLAYLIPDVPEHVQLAIERERYLAKITIEGGEPAEDDEEAVVMLGGTTEKSQKV
jgi:hypothetical protein